MAHEDMHLTFPETYLPPRKHILLSRFWEWRHVILECYQHDSSSSNLGNPSNSNVHTYLLGLLWLNLVVIYSRSPNRVHLVTYNIYNLSSWCRTTCVSLLLVRHHEPVYRLPNGLSRNNNFMNELHTAEISGPLPYATPEAIARKRQTYVGMFFTAANHVIMQFGRYFNSPL
jgi:hypothetical protein